MLAAARLSLNDISLSYTMPSLPPSHPISPFHIPLLQIRPHPPSRTKPNPPTMPHVPVLTQLASLPPSPPRDILKHLPLPPPQLSSLAAHRLAFRSSLALVPSSAAAFALRKPPPGPPPLILLDYDDTLLPTTALQSAGAMADLDAPLPAPLVDALLVLEHAALALLTAAAARGTLVIITNAGDGWVELSSRRFLPAVRAFIDAHRVRIVSARALYSALFADPLQWKTRAFRDEMDAAGLGLARAHQHKVGEKRPRGAGDDAPEGQEEKEAARRRRRSVVVVGDSVGDQYAGHVAAAGRPALLKVVKFVEAPSAAQLAEQVWVVVEHLAGMVGYDDHFDVAMYRGDDR